MTYVTPSKKNNNKTRQHFDKILVAPDSQFEYMNFDMLHDYV